MSNQHDTWTRMRTKKVRFNAINRRVVTFDVSTEETILTQHGFYTGQPVRFLQVTTLPTGLTSLTTQYFVIKTSADRFKVATSAANAALGTAVALSGTPTTDNKVGASELIATGTLAVWTPDEHENLAIVSAAVQLVECDEPNAITTAPLITLLAGTVAITASETMNKVAVGNVRLIDMLTSTAVSQITSATPLTIQVDTVAADATANKLIYEITLLALELGGSGS